MKRTMVLLKMKCGKCKRTYKAWWWKDDAGDPPCTLCHPPMPMEAPGAPAIGTNRMRALRIAEKEMLDRGFTDMKDNLRPGETAVKLTPNQSKMADAAIDLQKGMVAGGDALTNAQQKMMGNFWGGAGRPGNSLGLPNANQMLAQARAGAQASMGEGSNPVMRIQAHAKSNPLPPGTRRKYA